MLGAQPAAGRGEEEEGGGREEAAGRDLPSAAAGGEGSEDEGQELLPGGEQRAPALYDPLVRMHSIIIWGRPDGSPGSVCNIKG